MSNTFGFQSPYASKPTSSSLSLSLPSAHSTCQLIFCLLLPPASRLNPRCSPPLLGWIFPLHSITHVSSRQLPPWGCSSTPGGVTRAQGKWASVSLFRHSMGCSLAVFLASNSSSPHPPWVPVLTSCQSTSSLATRLFSPVFKEKYGYSESLKNPSLSIVRSQQDCYQTKNVRNLPLPFKSAKLCFVNNCSQLPNLRRMPFICIHVRVVILNGNQSLSGTSKALL